MKKTLLYLLLIVTLALTGCQSAEDKKKAEIAEAFENMGVEHEEVIRSVLSKEWYVRGGEDTYTFTKEGTGEVSGKAFTYACGFDEENQIMLTITMEDSKEELHYYVESDDTGHGLFVTPAVEGDRFQLIMSNVTVLDLSDERAAAMVGEWADKSDNRYVLNEDFTAMIKGSTTESEGTYSVVERDGTLLLTLVAGSSTLEFACEISENGSSVNLQAPGVETVHTWIKK